MATCISGPRLTSQPETKAGLWLSAFHPSLQSLLATDEREAGSGDCNHPPFQTMVSPTTAQWEASIPLFLPLWWPTRLFQLQHDCTAQSLLPV